MRAVPADAQPMRDGVSASTWQAAAHRPYWLSAPALAVYAVFLVVPIVSIALISFQHFEFYGGIQPGLHAGELPRRSRRQLLLGDLRPDVRHRRRRHRAVRGARHVRGASCCTGWTDPWKSLFLLVVLGPLLISVVVRTLGWALLFGSTGLINRALLALGLVRRADRSSCTRTTGVVIALTHVLVPFVVISVWASLQRIDPAVERAAVSLGASRSRCCGGSSCRWRCRASCPGSVIVFALAASAFATPAIIGGRRLKVIATAAYDEFLNTLNWPLGACARGAAAARQRRRARTRRTG